MENTAKRVNYMDLAKALGIILVVIGHSNSPFDHFIWLFHMPLFFFISGYFYKDKYSCEPKLLFTKRIKSLYIPFIKYQLIFLILHNLFVKINIYSDNPIIGSSIINPYVKLTFIKKFIDIITFGVTEQLAGTFWFFVSLFIVNIIFCLISYISQKYVNLNKELFRCALILILFVIGGTLSMLRIRLPRNIDTSFVVILIYYLGYLYKKYEKHIVYNIFFFLISFVILIICSFYGTNIVAGNQYPNPLFFLITSILGIYVTLYISKYLSNLKFKFKLLNYIGNETIIIMALQFVAFKLVNQAQIWVYGYPQYMLAKFPIINSKYGWWIIYAVVGVLIPILIKYISDEIIKTVKNNIKTTISA